MSIAYGALEKVHTPALSDDEVDLGDDEVLLHGPHSKGAPDFPKLSSSISS
jgi:hypothetical protein